MNTNEIFKGEIMKVLQAMNEKCFILSKTKILTLSHRHNQACILLHCGVVATPLWPTMGVKPTLGKAGDLESSGTPECSELDSKAQNALH